MGKWVCYSRRCRSVDRAGVAWESALPVCPTCGSDGRTRGGSEAVVATCEVHWQRPSPDWPDEYLPGRACDGGPEEDGAGAARRIAMWEERGTMPAHRWTTLPNVHSVTCGACRATPDFAGALARTPKPVPVMLIGSVPVAMDRGSIGAATAIPVSDVGDMTLGDARREVPRSQPGQPVQVKEDTQNVA